MLDDSTRTEVVPLRLTQRLAADLCRAADRYPGTVTDYIDRVLREHLYGVLPLAAVVPIATKHKAEH
jgi:hypothetical protein